MRYLALHGSDIEEEYFADGISEDIMTALSKWCWLFVIARNTSFVYKGSSSHHREDKGHAAHSRCCGVSEESRSPAHLNVPAG
jgi:TolB-like protein